MSDDKPNHDIGVAKASDISITLTEISDEFDFSVPVKQFNSPAPKIMLHRAFDSSNAKLINEFDKAHQISGDNYDPEDANLEEEIKEERMDPNDSSSKIYQPQDIALEGRRTTFDLPQSTVFIEEAKNVPDESAEQNPMAVKRNQFATFHVSNAAKK